MKKILTMILSFVLAVITAVMTAQTVFAETTSKYWEPISNVQGAEGYVNSKPTDEIYIEADAKTNGSKITYNGDGKLTGWEFPLLEEGKDYKIISQSDNCITIKLINENHELPYINALVEFGETTVSSQNTENNNMSNYPSQERKETEKSTSVDNKEISTSIKAEANRTENDTVPKSDNQNISKIIIICVAAVCILLTALIIVKNKKH